MKFFYKFSNILGSVYNRGNIEFTKDGLSLLSPVGNKIVFYNLQSGQSRTIQAEGEYNYTNLSISPNGLLLLASTEKAKLYLISLTTGSILYRKDYEKFGEIVCLSFSPDAKYFVVCVGNDAIIYLTPGIAFTTNGRELSPFRIFRIIKANYDEITCICWSINSNYLAIGSKDLTVKVVSVDQKNCAFKILTLSAHSDILVKVFFSPFSENDLSIISLSKDAQLYVWDSPVNSNSNSSESETKKIIKYKRRSKHFLKDDLKSKVSPKTHLTDAAYNIKIKILVTGFSNGSFLIHEMPDICLIHCLEIENLGYIDALSINPNGDWIALASGFKAVTDQDFDELIERSKLSQLIVWEWASESLILSQIGTGAGYTHTTQCLKYSPDGLTLATGGSDGILRVWNTFTGLCSVRFAEHKDLITAIEYQLTSGGKVLISASLDGTVRAYDLNRNKNFRILLPSNETLKAQFISLSIDSFSGDFIAAGAQNFFDVFLWSLKTGKLLECLTGHQAPVSGVSFSPINNILVSCSWDNTIRTWNMFEGSKCIREIITLSYDAMCLAFRPDGNQFAVGTINGNIYFFNPETAEMNGVPIEGSKDLGYTVSSYETAKDSFKYFSTIDYSSDGMFIIGGGKCKNICIYHIAEKLLIKKYTITKNKSIEGCFDYISKRKRSEFNFNEALIAARDEDQGIIQLPGVKRGDFGDRSVNVFVSVNCIQFSPTMSSFAAATTEGILIYSDIISSFNPFQLECNINPNSILSCIESKNHVESVSQSLRLNDILLITQVLESISLEEIDFVVRSLSINYIERLLKSISTILETTRHLEFYMRWTQSILLNFGVTMKSNYSASSDLMATLRLLQRNITERSEELRKMWSFNFYRLKLINLCAESGVQTKMETEDIQ